MSQISCYYYTNKAGHAPAKEFIESLDQKTQAKFFFVKALLQEYGYKLPQPHAKYLGDSIYEFRFAGTEGAIRILYFFFHQEKVIFTNGFIKKKNKTPKRIKWLAMERRKTFLAAQ